MEVIDAVITVLGWFLVVWDTITWPIYQAIYRQEEI
jgi:hypothetical protein